MCVCMCVCLCVCVCVCIMFIINTIVRYGDAVRELDYGVGQILSTLKSLEVDNNTLVIFSSDNNNYISSHLKLLHFVKKMFLYLIVLIAKISNYYILHMQPV